MALYIGAAAGSPIMTIPVCFTGTAASLARGAIATGFAFMGALIIGFAATIVGMEAGPVGMVWGAVLGAIAGALVGGVIAVAVAVNGTCPCPPGAQGFCIRLIFLVIPGTGRAIPFPPFAWSDPTLCPVLVPPGCP